MTCKARAYQSHRPGIDATIEERITSLERNIELLHERITCTDNEYEEEFRKTADALKNESQAREAEDGKLHEKLESIGIGGVHISAIGALWLFVGVILSTAAPEIQSLLK